MKYIFCFLLFVLSTNFLSEAHAHDIQGSKDYPLIERYTGSEIIAYKALPYDRFNLYLGKNASADQTNASQLLEGTVLRIVYRIPKGTTPQNVYEYYQSTLNKSAFAILYQTTSLLIGDNFDVITNHQTEEGIDTPLTRNSINQYYLTAKIKDRFNNELYANIVIGEIKQNSKWRCPWHPSNVGIIHEFEAKKGDIIAVVYLIQPKKLDNKMINITQMQSYETDHDLMGSQDYTNIKRYEGSEIIGYKNISFDRYTLGLSNTLPNSDFSKTLDLEGEITRIVYRIPGDHSSYEILQNYKQTFLDTNLFVHNWAKLVTVPSNKLISTNYI